MKPFKVCFFRLHNGVGDVVISNFFIRELHKLAPNVELTVVASHPTEALYKDNPRVQQIIEAPAMSYPVNIVAKLEVNKDIVIGLLKTLWKVRRGHYDLLITDFISHLTPRNMLFFALCGAKRTVLPPPADKDTTLHRMYSYGQILQQLEIKDIDYTYEMFLSPQAQEEAALFLKEHHIKPGFIVLNPAGRLPERILSNSQINHILKMLHRYTPQNQVVLLDYKHQFTDFSSQATLCRFTNIPAVAALIKQAASVITVDTSTLHIADVFQKPILALYASNSYSGDSNNRQIFSSIQKDTIYLQSHDQVSDIPLNSLEEKLQQFVANLRNDPLSKNTL